MSAKKHPACKRNADHLIPLYPMQSMLQSIPLEHTYILHTCCWHQPSNQQPHCQQGRAICSHILSEPTKLFNQRCTTACNLNRCDGVRNTSIWCGVCAREMRLCQGQQYKRNNKVVKRGGRVGCESCVCLCYASRKRKLNTRSWMGGSEDAKEH